MVMAVLELNDQGLLIQSESGATASQLGFAQLTSVGIEYGQSAWESSWLKPQLSYNQYWRQLGQTALPIKYHGARHNADIAYGQLKQLYELVEQPDSTILAVPASFNEQQLSLILGMLAAIPTEVVAVIDSALAVCLQQPKGVVQDTLLVDLQLHQTVISVCQILDNELQITDQLVLPDLGVMTLYNAVAQHVSKHLIEHTRFDPLHDSAGEQAIYDQLPNWLLSLSMEKEISVSVPSPQGELSVLLRKTELATLLTNRCANLIATVDRLSAKYSDIRRCFTDRSKVIPAFIGGLADADIATANLVLSNCFAHTPLIIQHSETIHCLQSLPLSGESIELGEAVSEVNVVSHMLYQHRAWSLQQPLSIRIQGESLKLSTLHDHEAELILVLDQQQLTVVHQQPSIEVVLPQQITRGAIIQVNQHQLQLIEVSDG
jgi:hypothetical protein